MGSDYIQSDKYLQDIVRDKRYWENKRQNVHQREKDLEKTIAKYEDEIRELDRKRKEILRQAKEQAQELLKESNRNIENTIREIRECQAEKEETKRLREELKAFKEDVNEIDTKSADDLIEKKMRQIMERKERREKRKNEKKENAANPTNSTSQLFNSSTPQQCQCPVPFQTPAGRFLLHRLPAASAHGCCWWGRRCGFPSPGTYRSSE